MFETKIYFFAFPAFKLHRCVMSLRVRCQLCDIVQLGYKIYSNKGRDPIERWKGKPRLALAVRNYQQPGDINSGLKQRKVCKQIFVMDISVT